MPVWFSAIDYIEAFFWSVTYIIIIFTAFINKNDRRFPISTLTVMINFAWEIASVFYSNFDSFSRANFIRFSWFFFDIFIFLLLCFKVKNKLVKKKTFYRYLIVLFVLMPIFYYCFKNINYGMTISAFVIDAHMEFMFWKNRRRLDPSNRLRIGIAKILGDFFAGLYYSTIHISAAILGVVALIFDVLYIIYAIKEQRQQPEIAENFKNNLSQFILDCNSIVNQFIKSKILKKKPRQKKITYKKKKKTKKTHRKSKGR